MIGQGKECGSEWKQADGLYSMTRWVKNWVQGHIVALTNHLTGEGRRWKPNDWLGP